MGLSPQQAKILLEKHALNLAGIVGAGKILNPQQVAMLEGIVSQGSSGDAESPAEGTAIGRFVKNKVELGKALNVTRKTIQRWMKQPGRPPTREDGRYDVLAWREFAKERGREVPDDDSSLNKAALQARQILLQNKLLEHKYAVEKKKFISVTVVEEEVGAMIQQAKKILLTGPASLAPQLVGVTIPEAEKILRQWLHDALSLLSENPGGIKSVESEAEDER